MLDGGVDVHIVVVEDPGIFYWLHHGSLKDLRKEGVFVWGIISTNKRMHTLSFSQHIVRKGQGRWKC